MVLIALVVLVAITYAAEYTLAFRAAKLLGVPPGNVRYQGFPGFPTIRFSFGYDVKMSSDSSAALGMTLLGQVIAVYLNQADATPFPVAALDDPNAARLPAQDFISRFWDVDPANLVVERITGVAGGTRYLDVVDMRTGHTWRLTIRFQRIAAGTRDLKPQ